MIHGDKYKHFKGIEYTFRGIALPLKELNPKSISKSLSISLGLEYVGVVKYHENTHDIELYRINGALFLKADKPHVIYQSEKDYGTNKYWAREVDDFFGYKDVDGIVQKKFNLLSK